MYINNITHFIRDERNETEREMKNSFFVDTLAKIQ